VVFQKHILILVGCRPLNRHLDGFSSSRARADLSKGLCEAGSSDYEESTAEVLRK